MELKELGLVVAGCLTAAWSLPLVRIARCWRGTSLTHAWGWLLLAWLGWAVLPWGLLAGWPAWPSAYLVVLLSAVAFVAVLGARLPGLAAWNFVVTGLLVVLLLPLLEQRWSSPGWQLDEIRGLFLSVILAVALLSHLPTGQAVPTLLAGGSCSLLIGLMHFGTHLDEKAGWVLVAQAAMVAAVWLAWYRGHRPPFETAERLWLAFRDRYGAAWSLRVIEQFNHAAKHAGWKIALQWSGFLPHAEGSVVPTEPQVHERLRQLLAKFLPEA